MAFSLLVFGRACWLVARNSRFGEFFTNSDALLSCHRCSGDQLIEDQSLVRSPSAGTWVLLGLKDSLFTLGAFFTFFVSRWLES